MKAYSDKTIRVDERVRLYESIRADRKSMKTAARAQAKKEVEDHLSEVK